MKKALWIVNAVVVLSLLASCSYVLRDKETEPSTEVETTVETETSVTDESLTTETSELSDDGYGYEFNVDPDPADGDHVRYTSSEIEVLTPDEKYYRVAPDIEESNEIELPANYDYTADLTDEILLEDANALKEEGLLIFPADVLAQNSVFLTVIDGYYLYRGFAAYDFSDNEIKKNVYEYIVDEGTFTQLVSMYLDFEHEVESEGGYIHYTFYDGSEFSYDRGTCVARFISYTTDTTE